MTGVTSSGDPSILSDDDTNRKFEHWMLEKDTSCALSLFFGISCVHVDLGNVNMHGQGGDTPGHVVMEHSETPIYKVVGLRALLVGKRMRYVLN